MEVVGVKKLEAEEGEDDLDGERTTVHEVAVEQLKAAVKEQRRTSSAFFLGRGGTNQEVKLGEEKDT